MQPPISASRRSMVLQGMWLVSALLATAASGLQCAPKGTDTAAVQAAIDQCGAAPGGGQVLLTARNYTTGSLFLRSNIVLTIAAGSTLYGTTDKSNNSYPQIYQRVAGTMQYGHAGLLNGGTCQQMKPGPVVPGSGDQCATWAKLTNVTINGGGTINGNGDSGWYNKPYEEDRPVLMGLYWIDGLTIHNLTLTNPAFWTVHPCFSNNIHVYDMNITTTGPNTDGFDPDSCNNVLLERSYISTGDDCIAIKSGKDQDGRLIGIPSQNIVIRDMVFGLGHGIAIGSEMSGGIYNVTLTNLQLKSTDRGVRIKSQAGRGGEVSNITYENIVMSSVQEAISISMFYSAGASGVAPVFKDINIVNVTASGSKQAGEFMCLDNSPCTGIVLNDVHIADYQTAFTCKNAHGTATNTSPASCLQQ